MKKSDVDKLIFIAGLHNTLCQLTETLKLARSFNLPDDLQKSISDLFPPLGVLRATSNDYMIEVKRKENEKE